MTSPDLLPRHLAVIMDGNRRWAQKRMLPATLGHTAGVRRVRDMVQQCAKVGIPFLTLFAFSTENWKRPAHEVSALMAIFRAYLKGEVIDLNRNGVRLHVTGDKSRFDPSLQKIIAQAEDATRNNSGLVLTICANYGGRWDVLQAVRAWCTSHPDRDVNSIDEESFSKLLSTAHAPEVDLLIRTGGESRLSNFLMWQTAYAELYFSDALWPDFSEGALAGALSWYQARDRRFGASASNCLATVPDHLA